MASTDFIGSNPVETLVQVVSAIATAAAAIFAALSARSAAMSAKEMQHARELSSAPVLTITPNVNNLDYYFDLSNGLDGVMPYKDQLSLENHGNGPALNLSLNYFLEIYEAPLLEEILVTERTGSHPSKCFASANGIRWERQYVRAPSATRLEAEEFIVSLAKSDMENISISTDIMRRWVLDALSFNLKSTSDRKHVAFLKITITFDTILKLAQQQLFIFRIISREMPQIGITRDMLGSNLYYRATIEPTSAKISRKRPHI